MRPQGVVIVGASVAGIHAALALDALLQGDVATPIYLVDPRETHYFRGYHAPLEAVLERRHVLHLPDSVYHIDPEIGEVMTSEHRLGARAIILAFDDVLGDDHLLRRTPGLRYDATGKILVTSGLQPLDYPNLWVIGAHAHVDDAANDYAHISHGRHAARAVVNALQSQPAGAYYPQKKSWVEPATAHPYGYATQVLSPSQIVTHWRKERV